MTALDIELCFLGISRPDRVAPAAARNVDPVFAAPGAFLSCETDELPPARRLSEGVSLSSRACRRLVLSAAGREGCG